MTDQQLSRLTRKELLELLLALRSERDALERELEQTKAALKAESDRADDALQQRRIQIEEAGSIAEAALQLNGVFEAAQSAAQQYLDNIAAMEEDTRKRCQAMEEEAKVKADAYWKDVSVRLEEFCKQYTWLKEILSFGDRK